MRAFLPGCRPNPDYRARVIDAVSLDQTVNGILADYSGFKLHTYQLEMELLAHLLSRRELYCEDVFLSDRRLQRRLVESLWSHLGVPHCANPRISRFVENASFRMGGPTTYGRLPNLAEIEATLGSDETGHISFLAPPGTLDSET